MHHAPSTISATIRRAASYLFLFKQIYVKNIFANNDTFKRLEITIGCTRTLAPDERMYWKYDRRIVSL